jgi:hypothetical protein
MTPIDRRIRIERMLADWFQREGFAVSGGTASQWVSDGSGDLSGGEEIEVEISRLADFLEEETRRAFA